MIKGQIDSLTSLRFFAAAMIVVGHGGSSSYFSYSVNFLDLRNAVSFFFVLSGFILSHAYSNFDFDKDKRSFLQPGFRGFILLMWLLQYLQ